MKRCLRILLGIAFLLPATILNAADGNWAQRHFFRIVHVTPDGQGDGKSWKHATSLQRLVDGAEDEAAILNPQGTVPCCQLWLGRGEHRLSKRLYANRDFHVSILGGFAGSETAAEDRDPEANHTAVVLDGCQLLFTRWAHQLTVDGLTIRDGEAEHGGAIDIFGSYGGGNNILISNVDFVNCRARLGGGAVRIQRASKGLETRNLRIVDCRFINCSATGSEEISGGGAVMIDKTSKDDLDGVLIRGCEFRGNCFTGNGGPGQGGGAVFANAPNLRIRPVCIEYCVFEDNSYVTSPAAAGTCSVGNAVYARASHLIVKHCDFVGDPDDLCVQGPGNHELADNRFVAKRGDARPLRPAAERGPAWNGLGDPGDRCYRDRVVSEEDRRRGRAEGAQYELYQPSITYSMICEGQTPPLYGKYQHCAAIAHFDGQFFVVWQSNPTVYIEWGRGRKIYSSQSTDFKTWTDPKLVAPDLPHLGGTQPMLLDAPNGELWCIWLCSATDKNVHGLWLSTRRTASGEWTHRRMLSEDRLDQEYSLYPQSKPWVLSSGRIIAPFIARVGDSGEPVGVFLYTDDDGATWEMSNWIRWPADPRGVGIWEIHGSEQNDGRVRVFARNLAYDRSRPDSVLLTTTGTGIAKGRPLVFDEEVRYAGLQSCQNRPQVFSLRGTRSCLLMGDAYVDQSTRQLPYLTASMYFSRSSGNDYAAGPALTPGGVHCAYPEGIEHDGGIYIAFTGEYPDDYRNIVGAKVDPSPDPDRFYLWPRRRELSSRDWSGPPELVDLDERRCVRFRDADSAGVDLAPLNLAGGDRLRVHFDFKVNAAARTGECVLLSFGGTAPGGRMPIRIGGPLLAEGRLSVATDTEWRAAADFSLGEWHVLSLEFAASEFTVRVDDQAPRSFDASANEPRAPLYLGEGVIVGDFEPSRGFEFAVDLTSLRTEVARGDEKVSPAIRSQ